MEPINQSQEPITKNCAVCGIEFTPVRKDTLYCSKQCKKQAFLKRSIGTDKRSDGTDNVIIKEPIIQPEIEFEFTVRYNRKPDDAGYDSDIATARKKVRTARYWYDVPLAAVPVLKEGWPKVPEFDTKFGPQPMEGRQYFLWWKNDFDTKDGKPIIYSPFPTLDNVRYEMGGEGARRWGA
jgi:hypothetical protein